VLDPIGKIMCVLRRDLENPSGWRTEQKSNAARCAAVLLQLATNLATAAVRALCRLNHMLVSQKSVRRAVGAEVRHRMDGRDVEPGDGLHKGRSRL
jgi:hypothetical protein